MIETEKAILATIIEYPQFVPILFENCTVDLFEGVNNKIIFKLIEKLKEKSQQIDWLTMFDLLKGKTTEGYIAGLLKCTDGIFPSGAERWLLEKIKTLKKVKAKKVGMLECMRELESQDPDFERIIKIAEQSKIVELAKETVDFETAYNEYLDWKERKTTDVDLGIPSFDRQTDDYNYGEVIGIMARTTVGKTFLAINIVNRLINLTEHKIGVFSLEMSKAALIERMMQVFFEMSRYEVNDKRKEGSLNIDEFMKRHEKLNIYSRIYSVSEISRLVERDGLRVVFIDYLQLLRKTKGRSLYEETSYQMEEIKELAKNREVVVFLLIQISRKGEGGWEVVTMDMARNSGTIEEHCDFLIGLWNPSLKENAEAYWNNKIAVRLLKNKRGSIKGVECHFDKFTGRIREIEK